MKSLKSKITSVYVFLVVIIAGIGVLSVSNLYGLGNSINGLMTDNYKSIKSVTHMNEALEKQNMSILNHIHTGSQSNLQDFFYQQDVFYKWYETEANNLTENGEGALVKQLNAGYRDFQTAYAELRKIREQNGASVAFQYYYKRVSQSLAHLRLTLSSISLLNENAMFHSKARVTSSASNSTHLLLMISIGASIIGLLVSFLLSNRFLRPLLVLKEHMRLVREDNIWQEVNVNTGDEIGTLGMEYNKMLARLESFESSNKGKLLDERNRSLAIVKSISDPLIVLDPEFRVILLNKACEQFFSILEKDVVGRHFLEAVRNNDVFDHIDKVCAMKEDKHVPKIITIQTNSKTFYFDTTVTKIHNENGTFTGLVVLFQNVTKLKRLERTKSEFVSVISHELKTPLTSIMMGSSLFRNEGLGKLNEKQVEILDAIEDDVDRLSTLVNDVIQLSKLESDRDIYHIHPHSIFGIIENCMRGFSEIVAVKQINLVSEVGEDLPQVLVDSEKISWVMNNLISNALKHSNAGDFITLNSKVRNGMMHVTVSDTGTGIPKEYTQRIFERFVKVESMDSEAEGTGLGLSIAKEIVTVHKGVIWCESKLDEGSMFTFTLPLA